MPPRERIADRLKSVHEPSHAVVVMFVGWRVESLTINDGAGGLCQPADCLPPEPRTLDIARRELLVGCAGFAAERLEQGHGPPTGDTSEWWGTGSINDRNQANWIARDRRKIDRNADRRESLLAFARLDFELLQRPDVRAIANDMAAELEHSRRLDVDKIEAAWQRHDAAPAIEALTSELNRLARLTRGS